MRLKEWRTKLGLSQFVLSEKVGVHENTVRRWESGQREPRASEITKLCEVLGVSEAELLRGPAVKRWEVRVISGNQIRLRPHSWKDGSTLTSIGV